MCCYNTSCTSELPVLGVFIFACAGNNNEIACTWFWKTPRHFVKEALHFHFLVVSYAQGSTSWLEYYWSEGQHCMTQSWISMQSFLYCCIGPCSCSKGDLKANVENSKHGKDAIKRLILNVYNVYCLANRNHAVDIIIKLTQDFSRIRACATCASYSPCDTESNEQTCSQITFTRVTTRKRQEGGLVIYHFYYFAAQACFIGCIVVSLVAVWHGISDWYPFSATKDFS